MTLANRLWRHHRYLLRWNYEAEAMEKPVVGDRGTTGRVFNEIKEQSNFAGWIRGRALRY
jgi:hypothetical protein